MCCKNDRFRRGIGSACVNSSAGYYKWRQCESDRAICGFWSTNQWEGVRARKENSDCRDRNAKARTAKCRVLRVRTHRLHSTAFTTADLRECCGWSETEGDRTKIERLHSCLSGTKNGREGDGRYRRNRQKPGRNTGQLTLGICPPFLTFLRAFALSTTPHRV